MEGEHISTSSSTEVDLVEDRLSMLPEEIRYHIMSLQPTHEAFKTTLLSKMWRTMWPSFRVLHFDYSKFPDVDRKCVRFLQFIRYTVAHHDESSLETFGLYLLSPECVVAIDNEWVTFALQHNVQNIVLSGRLEIRQEIPECLFTCSSIVTMRLSIKNVVLKWPEAAVLPNLRELALLGMALSENLSVGLSSGCPRLETLMVYFCNIRAIKVFSITSPRLKILTMSQCLGIENCKVKLVTPSLEQFIYVNRVARDFDFTHFEALSAVNVVSLGPAQVQRREDCCLSAVKLARGVCGARSLSFNEFFIKFLSSDVPPSGNLGLKLFHNLEMVSLCFWPTREQVLTTLLLLSRCPKLSVVEIVIAERSNVNDQAAEIQFSHMLSQLTSVQITEFKGTENEMELVRIFLTNGPSLGEMKIGFSEDDDSDPDSDSDSDSGSNSDSDSDNPPMTIEEMKSKILQMQGLARSSCINISFSELQGS